jgi:hypothetical protein
VVASRPEDDWRRSDMLSGNVLQVAGVIRELNAVAYLMLNPGYHGMGRTLVCKKTTMIWKYIHEQNFSVIVIYLN